MPTPVPRHICPVCAADESTTAFLVGDRNRQITDAAFLYCRCTDCRTLFLTDIPADLGNYYQGSGGGDYFDAVPSEDLDRISSSQQWRLDLVQPYVQGGTAIEIGPGAGHFAHLLKRAGFKVYVIEQDPAMVRHLREAVGVTVTMSAEPEAALYNQPKADLVALWHALEHLPDPTAAIRAAADRLKPNGALVIAIPNLDSLGFKLLGKRWPHVDAPRHLTLIPPAELRRQLERAGLVVKEVTTRDEGSRFYNRFAWERVLRPPDPGPVRGPLAHHGARLLTTLAGPLENRDLAGATVTVVAEKPNVSNRAGRDELSGERQRLH